MNPLLSIIVPTKDRYEYLKPLIELVKGFAFDEVELVVQDNTKNNGEILQFIQELDYPHLKYFHTPEQISVSDNCDLGILNSTGKYLCLLGDDDGVSKHILEAVHWMDKNKVEVLRSTMMSYKWPSFNFSKIANFSAVLMLGIYNKSKTKINPVAELHKSLKSGGGSVYNLPKVYHGIAKRSTMDKIYKIGGTYFPGASPDISNAVAMCFVTDNFMYWDFPIIIPGNSIRTGGDAQKYKGQCAPVSEIAFLPKDTEKKWESFIPKVWSAETIMPESLCKSLRYMGKEDFIKHLDKEMMLAHFVVGHPELKNLANAKTQNKIKLNYYIGSLLFSKYLIGAYNKILNRIFSVIYYKGSHTGGFFNKRNYYRINRGLHSIHDANDFIMNTEKYISQDR